MSNLKIIRILFLTAFSIGIITVLLFYNAASKLKFIYTDYKNSFSKDNKYLAVVNDSGLWLKDEIEDSTLIVKASYIENDFLINVIINEFDNEFNLKRIIQSEKININDTNWILENPKITNNNITNVNTKDLVLKQVLKKN